MSELIKKMNKALGLELRAINLYAHYAAYVKGLHRLQLEPMFQQEATESMVHAATIRNAIVKHGGICVTERDDMEIKHTNNYRDMLQGALETEEKAAKTYGDLLKMLDEISDRELYDAVEQIYLAELRSVEEIRMLLERIGDIPLASVNSHNPPQYPIRGTSPSPIKKPRNTLVMLGKYGQRTYKDRNVGNW